MTKRIFSILLASIMCLSLSVTALAAESEEYVLPTEYGNCGSIVLNDNGEGVVEIPMSSNTIPSIIPLGGGTELGVQLERKYWWVPSLWRETI